jgi:hypothetical protein
VNQYQVQFKTFFKLYFLEKFGDGKPLEVFVMDLSSLKMNPKEKVKYFNQRFLTLKIESLQIPCLLRVL